LKKIGVQPAVRVEFVVSGCKSDTTARAKETGGLLRSGKS
jgi:hypothetical protein